MARPRRVDMELVTQAQVVVAQATDVDSLGCAQAVLLPAVLGATLEQTAMLQMSRTPVIQQAVSNAWLKEQGLLSVKDLWCKAPGLHGKEKRKSFVERANLLNRPLRTRMAGGVGGDG